MLQSLRGLKLPRRLLTALYRRTIALLLHCVKHPIKTIFFVIKAYLLLMLFAFFLAFSVGSFAQESQPTYCPEGTFQDHPELGPICSEPAPKGDLFRYDYGLQMPTLERACDSAAERRGATLIANNTNPNGTYHSFYGELYVASAAYLYPGCKMWATYRNNTNNSSVASSYNDPTVEMKPSESYCPPDNSPSLLSLYPVGNGNFICWKAAEQPPCDCSDLTGSNPQGINYFYASPGTYSQASPPNCINRDDNENSDVPSCNCKLIATKWVSADVNINGTLYTRWQPVPDQSGVTGVFTGGQCDESEKDTPPDEPEKCYNLGNGQRFCLEDPDKKCAKIDGIMTCQAGCGTVNGEFFCFEDEPPEEEIPDPNDDITDPDKPISNMIKQDFKDVLGGTEQRLDILAKLLSQIKTDTGKGDGAMASKQDATNRLLKEISDKLDGEDGDNETPTNPQPTYNTDKLEEFVNPNDWGEKNFRTVGTAFKDRLMEAPVMQAVNGFFDVALSGSCPTWQTTVSMPFGGSFAINIDQLCSETMNNIWPAIRAIIVLIFTFLAFRVAFTNE
ncbi:hypothetical protein J2X32_001510 [Rheinheimera pacifica]|uniref:hypothetical protein n=1 Tax=Rheinheimera pacifica TaxID=173990 RepID=UPI00285970EA|nr:hypothetical protein [Rheinheimera pacifica]MDR6982892.1 hypothetical protein [Rheinheimera pacifica]